jgi:hypothetical protein
VMVAVPGEVSPVALPVAVPVPVFEPELLWPDLHAARVIAKPTASQGFMGRS